MHIYNIFIYMNHMEGGGPVPLTGTDVSNGDRCFPGHCTVKHYDFFQPKINIILYSVITLFITFYLSKKKVSIAEL